MGKMSDTGAESRFQVPALGLNTRRLYILCVCVGLFFLDPPTSHPHAPAPDISQKMDGCTGEKENGIRRNKWQLRSA